jgi:hypothetical protein
MSDNQGIHESFEAREKVKTSSDRSFGVVFTGVFLVVTFGPVLSGGAPRWWALAVAGVFLAVSIFRPALLAPLNRLWTRFGLLLNRVVNPIVMGLLFFLIITPIAVVMRVMGKRPLQTDLDRTAASYWVKREPPGPAPESMKQQF